jgi:hypothetical protein
MRRWFQRREVFSACFAVSCEVAAVAGSRRGRPFAWALVGASIASCLALPAPAGAEQGALSEASRTFEYREPAPKAYWRAAIEEVGLIGAGLGYYFMEQRQNSIDWALNYDWMSFRQKLTCQACRFDQNFFDTNFVTHPAAGMLYYLAARGNRLSVLESFAYAGGMSTLWEFLGEFRERVSVNDFFVTPIAGLVLGESTTQLGAFFDRSCATPVSDVLGTLLGPAKSFHDAVDEVHPKRTTDCDARGLDRGGEHRFRFWAGASNLWTNQSPEVRNEARFGVETSIARLDSIGRSGQGWLAFADGNVSSIEARMGVEDANVSDFRLGGRVVPAGLHYRDLRRSRGGALGHEVLLGLLVQTEYALHRRERPAGAFDRVFLIESPASTLGWRLSWDELVLELSLDTGVTLAGVSTFALPEYLSRHGAGDLASVTRLQGYSHALGLALAPRVRVRLNALEFGAEGRSDRFSAIRELDPVANAHGMTPIFETRRRGQLWISVGPVGGVPRVTFFLEGYQRAGSAGDVSREQREQAVGGSLDATF